MVQLVPIALLFFIPLAVYLFSKMPARKALIVGALGATMFLPMGEIQIPTIPFGKVEATSIGLLIAALLMEPGPVFALRPRLVDLPMVLLCFTPYASAMANGMSPYDGFAATLDATLVFGVPFALGRAYLTDFGAIRDAAQATFTAGLIYAPLCIIEMILGPLLHVKVYGYPAHPDYMQSYRFGGWRPMVFMQHGLMVGMFMACAATIGVWLWYNGALKKFKSTPTWLPVFFLLLVAVWCRSAGALILMGVAFFVLIVSRFTRNSFLVYVLAFVAPVYIFARTVGGWTGDNAVALATEYINPDHGASLQTRFDNENIIVERAMTKALLGWGPGGDYLIKDDAGRITSVPDGMWVIQLGTMGLIGLAALFGSMLMPTLAIIRRYPAKTWTHPASAAPAVLAVFLATYAIDCLMNAMRNPVYIVCMGGLSSLAIATNPSGQRATRTQGRSPGTRPNSGAAAVTTPALVVGKLSSSSRARAG
jgi:hypothetical protein